MSATTLKDKMRDFNAGKAGSVSVSGADLAAEAAAAEEVKDTGPTTGKVEAEVPQEAKADPLAETNKTGELHQGMVPQEELEKIDITDEDREAFLQAIITGGRYERDFSLFGGKLRGTFRSRLQHESDGISAYITSLISGRKVTARIEYLTVMRGAVLAAQVKCLRGILNEDFPELAEPYAPKWSDAGRKNEKGEAVKEAELSDPGWLSMMEAWCKRPEALVTAVHNELQKFEWRYWAMLKEAANENFWNPAAST